MESLLVDFRWQHFPRLLDIGGEPPLRSKAGFTDVLKIMLAVARCTPSTTLTARQIERPSNALGLSVLQLVVSVRLNSQGWPASLCCEI